MNTYFQCLQQLEKNEKQSEAFTRQSHTVVIAGPGSGKTHVLALRIVKLLRDEITPPKGIACLTYTRLMARELEKRLFEMGVPENRPNVVINTVHGFCLNYVVRPFAELYALKIPFPIRIASADAIEQAFENAFCEVHNAAYESSNYDHRQYRTSFNVYRRQHTDISLEKWTDQDFARLYLTYTQDLHADGLVDFDLIIEHALHLLIEHHLVRQSIFAKFEWLAVDEYQDLGYPLFQIITTLIDKTAIRLFAIGDPNQAIFDFAGTDPKYLLELADREDVRPTVNLNINYRCTQPIIDIATTIETPYCEYVSNEQEMVGSVCRVYEYDAPWKDRNMQNMVSRLLQAYRDNDVSLSSIAVLHRWRTSGVNKIAQTLKLCQIPFVLDKTPHYDRSKLLIRWLEDLCYWCLTGWTENNPRDVSFHELLRTWGEIAGTHRLEENSMRLHLTRTLWKLKGVDLPLHDWLIQISTQLSLDKVFQQYINDYPDDVQEFYKLLEKCAPEGELSAMNMVDFAQIHNGVNLLTLHSSKGMQFEHVIIPGIESIEKNENGRRLLYVGITRSRSQVNLLYNQYDFDTKQKVMPTYINELVNSANNWEFFHHFAL